MVGRKVSKSACLSGFRGSGQDAGQKAQKQHIRPKPKRKKISQRLERDFPGLERGSMGRTESSEVLGQR